MATEQVHATEEQVSWMARAAAEADRHHPLAPLTTTEIRAAVQLVRGLYIDGTNFRFKQVTLLEAPKAQLAPYLDALHAGKSVQPLDRKAFVTYYLQNTDKFFEAIVNFKKQTLESNVRLGANQHGNGDGDEIVRIENTVLNDERVKAEIAKLQLPEGSVVVCDPWIYGSDGIDDDQRLYQCFMYMRHPDQAETLDSNHYALPLPISPVVETKNYTLYRIDIMPTGPDHTVKPLTKWPVHPPNDYMPDSQQLRTDLKPLNVIQPEGASFRVTGTGEGGEAITWQKWSFRVGFNSREGMVLYDVRYDDRPLFYRISLSDMSIPYADPRHPFHKKAAFDLGDAGAGIMANDLQLGCDCLGSIHYLSAVLAGHTGEPEPMPNVVCVHEQDAGIGWKHTNYRTGTAAVVRNRELVLQTIITVSNYEYILAYVFNQAGELTYEVRATGILSTQPIDEGVDVPWGTIVHPGVLASFHQHIFSLRIDPMLDGHANRLVYQEIQPMPRSDDFNPHGVGYYGTETVVEQSAGMDLDTTKARTFKIQNASSLNAVNGKPVSYKISAPDFQKILADKQSFHYRRAEFADHNIYVTAHRDAELFAAGTYTNQSRGGVGVRTWAARKDNVKDDDIVVWVQFGMQHVPRIEDFPVMPVEIMRVHLKPVNFFARNPALDVPPSTQQVNNSTLVAERHGQPGAEGVEIGASGEVCCSSKL